MRNVVVLCAVTAAAVLLPAGAAHAACKTGLTNVYSDRYVTAKVVTSWCYSNGNVTSRNSLPSASVTNLGYFLGLRESDAEWTYSACHRFNGYPKHNCLTRRQFSFGYAYKSLAPKIGICIATRIYGNGAHHRAITTTC